MAGQTTNYLFDYPTSTDYVKDGATAIETLADDVDATLFTALGGAYPGLRLVKKQTIGSAVSSVTVTDAFSATYENYKIIISGGVMSLANNIQMVLGSTTSNYKNQIFGFAYANGVEGFGSSGGSSFSRVGLGDTNTLVGGFDLFMPFLAKQTIMDGMGVNTGGAYRYCGIQTDATSFTAFTLSGLGGSGTFTGGTIYVYGYGVS
jgi:hypothetical protein